MSDSLRPYGLWPTRLLCPWRFCRQEYCNGLPSPSPGDLPDPGIEPRSPVLQANSLLSESAGKPERSRARVSTHTACFQNVLPQHHAVGLKAMADFFP